MFERRSGLTLLQFLLIVAGVATILLLLARQYNAASRNGAEREMINDLRNYTAAQEVYHANNGSYAKGPGLLPAFLLVEGAIVESSLGTTSSWALRLTHDRHLDLICFASSALPPSCDERVASREITPTNRPPVAVFDWLPEMPRAGDPVRFDGSGSADPEGIVMRYEWTLPAGPVLDSEVITFTFAEPGTHRVTLRVFDDQGQTGHQVREIVVSASD